MKTRFDFEGMVHAPPIGSGKSGSLRKKIRVRNLSGWSQFCFEKLLFAMSGLTGAPRLLAHEAWAGRNGKPFLLARIRGMSHAR
jgi:hypothetical protein